MDPQNVNPASLPLFSRKKLYEILNSVVPGGAERIDPAAEIALIKMTETFVSEVSRAAADLALLRRSTTIVPGDVALHLRAEYGMLFPGLPAAASLEHQGGEERRSLQRIAIPTSAHLARTAHANRAASMPTNRPNTTSRP